MSFGARLDEDCVAPALKPSLVLLRANLDGLKWDFTKPDEYALVGYQRRPEPINSGGFGTVYMYWAPGDQAAVAVKITRAHDPHEVAFLKKSSALSSVIGGRLLYSRRPDVARHDPGRDVVAMEFADEDLVSLIGKLSLKQAVSVGKGLLLDAIRVYEASTDRFIHTDLKPDNCMYVKSVGGPGDAPTLRVVLVDFGSFSPEGEGAKAFTYFPPEILQQPLERARVVVSSGGRIVPATTQQLFTYSLAVLIVQLCSESFAWKVQDLYSNWKRVSKASFQSLVDEVDFSAFISDTMDFKALMLAAGAAERALVALAGARTLRDGLEALEGLEAPCLVSG